MPPKKSSLGLKHVLRRVGLGRFTDPADLSPGEGQKSQSRLDRQKREANGTLRQSDILDGVDNSDSDSEDHKKSHYTVRGTTVLTHLPGNREVKQKSRIVVAVRKRPLSANEEKYGYADVMETDNESELILHEPKVKVDLRKYTHNHRFFFDQVFGEDCSNADVYGRSAYQLLDTVFDGGNATCFAYGQTGSGKTHTMLGTTTEPGLYALAAQDMFDRLEEGGSVFVSFYEIYSGKLFDLLNDRNPLRCLEDDKKNVNIRGLTEHLSSDVEDVMNIISRGSQIRSSGTTGANDTSSRSHAILELKVRQGATNGKFTFIDLAGSERGADTMDCDRQTRLEGSEINKSLLALKECIRSLDQNKRHVPFRGSKLTEVLRDCFVGNCKTVMIGAVSPSNHNCEHTLNTLRYADRVKELKKNPASRLPTRTGEQNELTTDDKTKSRRLTTRLSCTLPPPTSRGSVVLQSYNNFISSAPSGKSSTRASVVLQGEKENVPLCGGERKRCREETTEATPDSPNAILSLAEEQAQLVGRYDECLRAEMDCIKEEYQLKFETEIHGNYRNFIDRSRTLIERKKDSYATFLNHLTAFEEKYPDL
ncbi:Kinesin motor domain/Microtubule binding, putative [Angomonas deanei]|uniref:Kinesin-like protein n=1 Tax=Angomonas deanei TaxID=59799 RepID=A0A7G2CNU2_9TRYP|nr:Kinesin motor domain/Microtubule binding, putative [Angomonas deanei]